MSNVRLVTISRLCNGVHWKCHILKTSYHTGTAETLRSSVDVSSPDYKVFTVLGSDFRKIL